MQTQTLNMSLPRKLVKRVDEVAKKEYRNRSELIRKALRVYLERISSWDKIFEAGEKAAKKMGIKSEEEVNKIVLTKDGSPKAALVGISYLSNLEEQVRKIYRKTFIDKKLLKYTREFTDEEIKEWEKEDTL